MDKHLKTLIKLLREIISRCDDPRVIEHNQKQIKSIETLMEEVKMVIQGQSGHIHGAAEAASNKLMESFFQISNDSLRDVQITMNNETQASIPDSGKLQQSTGKRRRIDDDGKFVVITSYDENAPTHITKKMVDIPMVLQSSEK